MAGVVTTIRDKCKRCYNCVRSCPAKAIKVEDGQAQVIEERCIACGNCYRVCAQKAKEIRSDVDRTWAALRAPGIVIACLAPSFAAIYPDARPGQMVSAVRALGFDEVLEVAFGAQLVAQEYARLFASTRQLVVSTPCPAVTTYIQKYVPDLVKNLAPIVSPAIALGRFIKAKYLPDATVVFFGPCVAKKDEITDPNVRGAVDIAITFFGLREMLGQAGIEVREMPDSAFDGPSADLARLFPLPGGLLRSAAIEADILDNEIVTISGKEESLGLLRSLERGDVRARFVDILFCRGCIDGPTMDSGYSLFARKEAVADYVGRRRAAERYEAVPAAGGLNLCRRFTVPAIEPLPPSEEEIGQILEKIGKRKREDQLDCGACGYATCREKAVAVFEGLAEVEMCLPFLIDQLQTHLRQLEQYQRELQETEAQLVQTEKLAALGQLAAGVAHELNNPLGSILLYSHLVLDTLPSGGDTYSDARFIVEETMRCKGIVAGLLDFARQREVLKQPTDLDRILEDTAALARLQPEFTRIQIDLALNPELPATLADPNQIKEVFWNIITNAQQAMPDGGSLVISSDVAADGQQIVLKFQDTGVGITEDGLKRLFTPFYTTKPGGTGLGLAIAYGIVKMHRGNIEVRSKPNQGSTFIVTLPLLLTEEVDDLPTTIG